MSKANCSREPARGSRWSGARRRERARGYSWVVLVVALAGCAPSLPPPPAGEVRVVSLAPSLTEILYAIGATNAIVGRSRVCVYPSAVTNVPVAGDFGAPSLEALARLRPHYVLTVDSEDRNTGRAIAQLGIRHEQVPCRTLDDIPRAIRRLGELTRRAEAAAVAGKLESELAALRRQPKPARPVRVFLEIWGDPLMTAGKTAFLTELVELAGGENVMGDVARDFFPVSAETVLARQPEVLILLEAPDQAAATRLIAARAGWAKLPARIVAGLDRNVLEVPGPRVLESVKILKERLER